MAAGLAVVAVGLFATIAVMRDEGRASGVTSLDSRDLGLASLLLDEQGVLDSDHDGLADALENLLYGSDPNRWNSSGGPVPDGWLAEHGFSPADPNAANRPAASPPAAELPFAYHNQWPSRFVLTLADVYGAGRPGNWSEPDQGPFANGLDPTTWDQNGDGLPDGWLLAYALDPLEDGIGARRLAGPEGLTVAEAFQHNTNPHSLDGDKDGLKDRDEIAGPANPRASAGPLHFLPSDPSRLDSAGAGVCDGYLVRHGLDPSDPRNSLQDLDRDGASTREEYLWSSNKTASPCTSGGLDPTLQSTAGVPIPDGWLIRHGLDPLDATIGNRTTQTAGADPRPAGVPTPATDLTLTVMMEYSHGRPREWSEGRDGPWLGGTDPAKNDTDHDGLGDAWELAGYRVHVAAEPSQPAGIDYTTTLDPTRGDSDGDNVLDVNETKAGTDGRRPDTDFDGLDDGTEVSLGLGLDPTRADSTASAGRPGDLLRDGQRYVLLEARMKDALAGVPYTYAGPPGPPRPLSVWAGRLAGAAQFTGVPSDQQLASLLGPSGDADNDHVVNILDADIDEDGVSNGPEITPEAYRDTRFGLGPLGKRSATDPLNLDTDGDLLRDAWEVEHGILLGGIMTLDPGLWDSDGDCAVPAECRNDGSEDPDGDGIEWPRFKRETPSSTPLLDLQSFPFTNVREQDAKTDPNVAESDGDGLLDGWKAFWGNDYPTRPRSVAALGEFFPATIPESPRPEPGEPQPAGSAAARVVEEPYWRSAIKGSALVAKYGEREVRDVTVTLGGMPVEVANVTGTVRLEFQDIQQLGTNGTNPYLSDTDGDTLPDWWEALHSAPLPGFPSSAKCVKEGALPPGLNPLRYEAAEDPDEDGLTNAEEFLAGTDPLCPDSDLGGVPDGVERRRVGQALDPTDPSDDRSLLNQNLDQDGDGAPDFEEITELGTRFDHPDTDGDGLLDGPNMPPDATCWAVSGAAPNLSSANATARRFLDFGMAYEVRSPSNPGQPKCLVFLGEDQWTDPLDGDDRGVGVPEGWLLMKMPSLDPGSAIQVAQARDHYALGRPAWWSEASHGPWWGGADPQAGTRDDIPNQPLSILRYSLDLDGDGLLDTDAAGNAAEDALPSANPSNLRRGDTGVPASADPTDGSLGDLERRLAAQASLNPAPYAFNHRNTVLHNEYEPAADTRPVPCLDDLHLGSGSLRKGTPVQVSGRLAQGGCGGAVVAGVAVEAILGGQTFGAAFTDAEGRFAFDVNISSSERKIDVPDMPGSAFRGDRHGTVAWTPNGAAPSLGPQTLLVRSYATPALRSDQETAPVTLRSGAVLTVDVPAETRTDRSVAARLMLLDTAGAPLRDPVQVFWDGNFFASIEPGLDGKADFTLPGIPSADAGPIALHLVSEPESVHTDSAAADRTVAVRRPGVLSVEAPARSDAGQSVQVRGQYRDLRAGGAEKGVSGAEVLVTVFLPSGSVGRMAQTGSDGRFEATIPLPNDVSSGVYVVTAAAAGTTESEPAASETAVALRGLVHFDQVSLQPLLAGTKHQVSGRVVDAAGKAVEGLEVEVALATARGNATTGSDGVGSTELAAALAPGPVRQALTFTGDGAYAPASHIAQRAVVSKTSLTLAAGTLARGGSAQVPISLTDGNGEPVGGAVVRVAWGTEPSRDVLTNDQGLATFMRPAPVQERLGQVLVKASYAGSAAAGLAASDASQAWSVRTEASFQVPAGPTVGGASMPLARLVDNGTGQPLAHRTVQRGANGLQVTLVTDSQGRIPLLPEAPAEDVAPQVLGIPLRFAGDSEYPATQATARLRILSPVELNPQVPDSVVTGMPTLVHAHLQDGRGASPGAGAVEVRFGDVVVGTSEVSGSPVTVLVTVPFGSAGGPASLTFRYTGSAQHAPAEAASPVHVILGATATVDAMPAKVGGTATLRVRLASGDEPLADRKVLLVIEGAPGGLEALTDADGVAMFQVTQGADELEFLVRAPADLAVSSASTAGLLHATPPSVFSPKQGVSWLAIAVGVTALILGAAAVVALRWRTPLDAALQGARRALLARGPDEKRVLEAYRVLEDAAIAIEVLSQPANTPRILEQALAPLLPQAALRPLDRLMAIFEAARYGAEHIRPGQRDEALASLRDVQRAMRSGRGGAV